MKKALSKIKVTLAALWSAIISFPFKAFGTDRTMESFQTDYWILYPSELLTEPESVSIKIIKIAQRLLAAIIFIVWIVNLIKIRKIDDKSLKQKKTKRTVIILLTILIVIFLMSLAIWLIKKYTA